jgi:hypothetical protein
VSQSKVFSARAKPFPSFEIDISRCSLETAKAYWDLQQQNTTMILLNSIGIASSADQNFKGKVSFLQAKWSQEMNSAKYSKYFCVVVGKFRRHDDDAFS